jgi:hypothetical protein
MDQVAGASVPAGAGAPAAIPQLGQNFAAAPSSVPHPTQNFFGWASGAPHSAQNFPPGCFALHLAHVTVSPVFWGGKFGC